MRSRSFLHIPLAAVLALFAIAQLFPATTSSFTATTESSGTITAAADLTAPTVDATVLQKVQGGVVDRIRRYGQFYVYAKVSDIGAGSVRATVGNLTSSSTATMSSGSWTIGGTTYNFRTALLTTKYISTATYSYSVTADDGVNDPSVVTDTVSGSSAGFAPSSLSSTNTNTQGRPLAGDRLTMGYNSTPDPHALYDGWNGSARTVSVVLADKSAAGVASDAIAILNEDGSTTNLGYVLTGGDYVDAWQVVTYANSTVALSGNGFVVTLGTPDNTSVINTDTYSRTMTWTSTYEMFNQWGQAATSVSRNSSSVKQF